MIGWFAHTYAARLVCSFLFSFTACFSCSLWDCWVGVACLPPTPNFSTSSFYPTSPAHHLHWTGCLCMHLFVRFLPLPAFYLGPFSVISFTFSPFSCGHMHTHVRFLHWVVLLLLLLILVQFYSCLYTCLHSHACLPLTPHVCRSMCVFLHAFIHVFWLIVDLLAAHTFCLFAHTHTQILLLPGWTGRGQGGKARLL